MRCPHKDMKTNVCVCVVVCVCVCERVSHHGFCDEQQQNGLLHHVLRTEATARTQKAGNSTKNGNFIPLSLTHTHVQKYTGVSVTFLSHLWSCNIIQTTLDISLYSSISDVSRSLSNTHSLGLTLFSFYSSLSLPLSSTPCPFKGHVYQTPQRPFQEATDNKSHEQCRSTACFSCSSSLLQISDMDLDLHL